MKRRLSNFITKIAGRDEVTKKFNVEPATSSEMFDAIKDWDLLYRDSESQIASVVSSEAARLSTIDMSVTFSDDARGKYLQKIFDNNRGNFRNKLELGIAYGSMVLKPDADGGIDFIPPTRYYPIDYDSSGKVTAIVFIDVYQKSRYTYNRLEYHRFERLDNGEKVYCISNRFYRSDSPYSLGVPIKRDYVTRWKDIEYETVLSGIEKPLWGYFKMPLANNIDIDSPLGVSIFSKAIKTISDFDALYTRWSHEIETSDKIVFVDNNAMLKPQFDGGKAQVCNPLPNLVQGLQFGLNAKSCIEEYTPEIRSEQFKESMQVQLDLISMQCGFSKGYLTFDTRTGAVTATQVESEDQRTNSTCTDIQQQYKDALEGLVYALNVFADLEGIEGDSEVVEVSYYMKDLYVNTAEDRERAYKLSQDGYIPKWKYLVDYEGYTEKEARNLLKEVLNETGSSSILVPSTSK